jgi:SET domain-containing protein
MLKIETIVRPSSIHGKGCFTLYNIALGELIWSDDGESPTHISDYPDNSKFINHSQIPNTGLGPNGSTIALRDIMAGEEITENYYETVPQFVDCLT